MSWTINWTMMKAGLRLANISMIALVALFGACGTGVSTPGPRGTDGGTDPTPYSDPGPLPPPPTSDGMVMAPDQQPTPVNCPDLAGTWKGTIEGKANTYLQNVQMTGTVTMTVTAGASPGEFTMTSLDVQAWSPLLPMFKVPLKTIGAHSFYCDNFNIAAPIEAQGKKGSGTISGQCTATQCIGTFEGKTDDETMDASGKFKIDKE